MRISLGPNWKSKRQLSERVKLQRTPTVFAQSGAVAAPHLRFVERNAEAIDVLDLTRPCSVFPILNKSNQPPVLRGVRRNAEPQLRLLSFIQLWREDLNSGLRIKLNRR
jgi:hypothetical protein